MKNLEGRADVSVLSRASAALALLQSLEASLDASTTHECASGPPDVNLKPLAHAAAHDAPQPVGKAQSSLAPACGTDASAEAAVSAKDELSSLRMVQDASSRNAEPRDLLRAGRAMEERKDELEAQAAVSRYSDKNQTMRQYLIDCRHDRDRQHAGKFAGRVGIELASRMRREARLKSARSNDITWSGAVPDGFPEASVLQGKAKELEAGAMATPLPDSPPVDIFVDLKGTRARESRTPVEPLQKAGGARTSQAKDHWPPMGLQDSEVHVGVKSPAHAGYTLTMGGIPQDSGSEPHDPAKTSINHPPRLLLPQLNTVGGRQPKDRGSTPAPTINNIPAVGISSFGQGRDSAAAQEAPSQQTFASKSAAADMSAVDFSQYQVLDSSSNYADYEVLTGQTKALAATAEAPAASNRALPEGSRVRVAHVVRQPRVVQSAPFKSIQTPSTKAADLGRKVLPDTALENEDDDGEIDKAQDSRLALEHEVESLLRQQLERAMGLDAQWKQQQKEFVSKLTLMNIEQALDEGDALIC